MIHERYNKSDNRLITSSDDLLEIPWLDKYRYLEPDPLEAVIAGFDNVDLVVCGHVHRPMQRRWARTIVSSCPSTTTEIALQLQPAARSQSFVGPRGCLLHLWDAGQPPISHLSHIGTFAGPHPFA